MNRVTQTIYQALHHLLKPLIKILLQHGVSAAEFSSIANQVFVEVAENEFQLEGKKQSTARIAVLTGLNRTEVANLRKKCDVDLEDESWSFHNRAARVVSGWLRDKNYSVDDTPRPLCFEGQGVTFSTLVKHYSGGMPVRAVLDELLRVGSVKQDDQGLIHLLQKAYIPRKSNSEKIRYLGESVADLIGTIEYNLEEDRGASRLQLAVTYHDLSKEVVEQFKAWSNEENMLLLKRFDQWLAEQEILEQGPIGGTGRYRAGVGIYYFEEEQP